MGRRPAATGVRGIHEVVADHGAGMQELPARACPQQCLLLACRELGDALEAPVAEAGAEPLAAGERPACGGPTSTRVGAARADPCGLPVGAIVAQRMDREP